MPKQPEATDTDLSDLNSIDERLFSIAERLRDEGKHRFSDRVERARQKLALAIFQERHY